MSSPGIDRVFERRLSALVNSGEPQIMQGGRKGVEKESLRVTPDGRIAQTPHPRALGSALTNENITTDYSEALIELVTPTFRTSWELLQYLLDLHQFVYRHLGDELLWATQHAVRSSTAMPSIPIAQFGKSNIGRMKTVYRNGLGVRYGRMMQAISGVHYNYSFPTQCGTRGPTSCSRASAASRSSPSATSTCCATTAATAGSFCICSACRRWCAIRSCAGATSTLPRLSQGHARTSRTPPRLRMSDLGYRNRNQAGLSVSVNSLDEYVRDLSRAISTPHPPYEKLGVKVDGEYRQLNANILQIENEYYSFIRPKRVARSGERPTKALRRAGVEYVEVRALDVSAFDPVGVNQNKLRFLEVFLALCLMKRATRSTQPAGRARREPRARRAARPRARPHAQARGKADSVARLGAGAARFDAGHLPRCWTTATRSGRTRPRSRCSSEDRRRRAHAFGANAGGAGSTGESFSISRCACPAAQGIFPGAVPAERAAPGGVRGRRPPNRWSANFRWKSADRVTFDQFLANYFRA